MVETTRDQNFDNTGRQPRQNQTDATDHHLEKPEPDKETADEFPVVPEPETDRPA